MTMERAGLRDDSVAAKRAIEALRSGVPNRAAVRELGAHQPEIVACFDDLLGAAAGNAPAGGVVVSGDFGSGKSHLLEYLLHVALDRGFVAGKVVISKETPLYDPAKVLRSALDGARVPDRRGGALPEVVERLSDRFGTEAYREFADWVNRPATGLNERFAATLFLYENTISDLELRDRIVRFWGGDPITVGELKRELRELGEGATWAFARVTEKELAVQRFRFVARLIRAAGYAGWVILFDEVELIGRYSLLQRARSYAEVARWVDGRDVGFPGIMAVLAKTLDFDEAVIHAKGDRDGAPNRLRARGTPEDDELAQRAERGVGLLDRGALRLQQPDAGVLRDTYERLRIIHARAYEWQPPPLRVEQAEASRPMRQYVRSWINEWDLRRLDATYQPEIEIERIDATYDEDHELEGEESADRFADD
ncbi:MAG: BREX system ATP-binding domain-containing protein [Longimicrobiales bacterium]